jgi:hypothetical protein
MIILPSSLLLRELKEDCAKMCETGGRKSDQGWMSDGYRDRIFVDGRRSKGFQWVPGVSCSGVQFYIWATVIFRFAGTVFTNGDTEKVKSHGIVDFTSQKLEKNMKKGI